MPVVLRHSETLELNIAEYHGAITLAELRAIADFMSEHSIYLRTDALNVIMPDADFDAVPLKSLDGLYDYYRQLFAPLRFEIFRNAAWICLSNAARRHVNFWVGERDARESMSSTIRQFETLTEAAEWLMLSESELELVERGEGFAEITRVDVPEPRVRAAG